LAVFAAALAFAAGAALAADKEKDKDKDDKKDPDELIKELVGKPAPDFGADFAVNGKPGKLSELKGKVVLLDFFAVWCGPCIDAFPELTALNKEYKDKGLEVNGVLFYEGRYNGFDKEKKQLIKGKSTPQEEQTVFKDFVAGHKLDYRILAVPPDDKSKVYEAFSIKAFPVTLLIDRKGVIRYGSVGHEPDEKDAAEKLKLLKASIDMLLAEKP
jgi:thiol-disulfide isomerase/thioredoxin